MNGKIIKLWFGLVHIKYQVFLSSLNSKYDITNGVMDGITYWPLKRLTDYNYKIRWLLNFEYG